METGKKATILYIEDDNASRLLVERVLSSRGYNVYVASDGLEGIGLAREKTPNLILTDINLPDMDGREVVNELINGRWERGVKIYEFHPLVV